jgi:hypothetical protein
MNAETAKELGWKKPGTLAADPRLAGTGDADGRRRGGTIFRKEDDELLSGGAVYDFAIDSRNKVGQNGF